MSVDAESMLIMGWIIDASEVDNELVEPYVEKLIKRLKEKISE